MDRYSRRCLATTVILNSVSSLVLPSRSLSHLKEMYTVNLCGTCYISYKGGKDLLGNISEETEFRMTVVTKHLLLYLSLSPSPFLSPPIRHGISRFSPSN